jgi:hypothetical protein
MIPAKMTSTSARVAILMAIDATEDCNKNLTPPLRIFPPIRIYGEYLEASLSRMEDPKTEPMEGLLTMVRECKKLTDYDSKLDPKWLSLTPIPNDVGQGKCLRHFQRLRMIAWMFLGAELSLWIQQMGPDLWASILSSVADGDH